MLLVFLLLEITVAVVLQEDGWGFINLVLIVGLDFRTRDPRFLIMTIVTVNSILVVKMNMY